MRKLERELARAFPFASIRRTAGGHLLIRLENGRSVIAAATPSDRRALRNIRAEIRRARRSTETEGAE
jgi:hypothetical protein